MQSTEQQPTQSTAGNEDALLSVNNLKVHFPITSGVIFQKTVGQIKAVDDVSFFIKRGETLGLVGESGSGKTTIGRGILNLIKPTSGEVLFDGEDVAKMKGGELRRVRRRMQVIFQDPYSSLNPRMSAGNLVGEPLLVHNLTKNKQEYREKIAEMFQLVGLSSMMMDRYPHEFSGGQRQRIAIARALVMKPDFVVCDEPVSALDVSIQAQIINLLDELQEELQLTYLFIAHDLSVVRHISDRIAVMYLGKLVEVVDSDELSVDPLHPYTRALLSAAPVPDPAIEITKQRMVLTGEVPSPLNPPSGCTFNPRCPMATEACTQIVPQLRQVKKNHWTACIMVPGYDEAEPSVDTQEANPAVI
jgi:oligopeptide transport system ATP-binding protein